MEVRIATLHKHSGTQSPLHDELICALVWCAQFACIAARSMALCQDSLAQLDFTDSSSPAVSHAAATGAAASPPQLGPLGSRMLLLCRHKTVSGWIPVGGPFGGCAATAWLTMLSGDFFKLFPLMSNLLKPKTTGGWAPTVVGKSVYKFAFGLPSWGWMLPREGVLGINQVHQEFTAQPDSSGHPLAIVCWPASVWPVGRAP